MPFPAEKLAELYRNHGGFVSQWNRATRSALQAGFIVPKDAAYMKAVAAKTDFMKK